MKKISYNEYIKLYNKLWKKASLSTKKECIKFLKQLHELKIRYYGENERDL